jgi:hypothetical protein
MHLVTIRGEGAGWIHLAQDGEQWRAVLNMVMNLLIKKRRFCRLAEWLLVPQGLFFMELVNNILRDSLLPYTFQFIHIHPVIWRSIYKGVSKSFRTGRLERELQTVQLAILWVSLVSFVAVTLCIASQCVFVVVSVHFVMTQSGNFWIYPRVWSWKGIWGGGGERESRELIIKK